MKHFFHAAARVEHLDHVAFYESRQPGLGREYLLEVEAGIALILESPQRFRVVSEPDIRRYRLARFPFWVIYRIESNAVQILALAHVRKRPGYWVARI